MPTEETTLYEKGGVKITNGRAIMGANTYPVADLTHVSLQRGNGDFYVKMGGSGSFWTAYRSQDRAEIQSIVDALNAARAGGPVVVDGVRRCPYCAEDVQAAAIVCKHCGRNIDPTAIRAEKQVASARTLSATAGVIGQVSCLLVLAGVAILTLLFALPFILALFP